MGPQIFIFGLFLLALIEAVTVDQKSSLTFVIDDTGSMQVDVHELKKTAKSIFDNVHSNSSQIDDFIVVTFNDPEVLLRNNEHSKSDFETALSDIEPRGGGNCAEMSLSGIHLGLENSRAGSLLWVFTDASAADMEKYYKVEELSQKLGSQVYVAVTGLCDDRTNPDFSVYRDLAIATNGQVFHLRKNEIGKIFKYVELLIEDRKDIVTSKMFRAGGRNQFNVNVDADMEELIIAVSGENPVVKVTSSRGVLATTDITRLGEIAVVTVDVDPGVYKVEVTSNSETHVVVSASTSLHFEHGFSVFSSSNINGTTRKPVPGTPSHLSIQLATEDPEQFDVRTVQILDMDDKVILEEPLELVNKVTQFYTSKKITPPDHMFKVAVKMYDTAEKTFITRHGLTPIKPQNKTIGDHTTKAPEVTIVGGPIINAAYYHPLQLRCKIKGYPTPSVIWTSSDTSANLTFDKQVSIFELPEDYISVLDISEVKNNATYTCSATNNMGIEDATVYVQTQVIIVATPIELPESATIEYLKTGRIACKVETFPIAKVSWHKNGKPLRPDGNLEVSKDGSVLTIRSMEPYMADTYNCLVENALLKKEYPFQLSISGLVPPTIKKINPNLTVMKNSKVDLKCSVTAGIPQPSIRWFYKDVAASESTNFNKDINTIHFDTVEVTNAGIYICLAENIAGSDSISFELNVKEKCMMPQETGPCRASITKWYYDSDLKKCSTFQFGGCLGNENNFATEAACRSECSALMTTQPPPIGKCQQPLKVGPCRASIPKWYYDTNLNECQQFNYGGCQGNENNFNSESACRSECGVAAPPSPPPIGKCQQPMKVGPCRASIPKWYYDTNLNECQRFNYGGCQGNENNFNSESACRSECSNIVTTQPPPIDKCQQPMKVGPCRASIPKWYYDTNLNECQRFNYGGCQGNENNFNSESACRSECSDIVTTQPPPIDKCQQPMKVGPCRASIPKWYYDTNLNECQRFNYGGCQGNENNFNSESACHSECSDIVTTQPPPIDKCQQPMKVGPCRASIPKWYYDTNLNECQRFNYGGCQGNENNFNSESACRSECSDTVTTQPPPIDKCQQPMKVGPCRASIPKWYYDTNLNECQRFNYGGCQGNENNFNSESACRSECSDIVTTQPPPIDKCQQPMKVGPCRASIPKWYYDTNLNECQRFNYGGCQGNENNFNSESACRSECSDIVTTQPPPIDKCQQPMKVGPCRASIPKWYYDTNLNECQRFNYGGCQGNENNFNSESACRSECSDTVTTQPPPIDKCQQPMKVGPCRASIPKWYYDTNLNECQRFNYGGCQGNENNFNSESACRSECSDIVTTQPPPIDKCQQPMKVGPCRASIPKWYYDTNLNKCQRFNYGGCQGNENNFNSESACRSECSDIVTTQPPPIDKCQQPMKVGPCRASIPKWYYDTNLNKCQRFNYGGCQGNENNFNSESACRSECSDIVTTQPPPIDKCQQPMKVGPCRASIPKWYYDTNLNECQRFNYGGCQGNENNFNSESACRSECSDIVTTQPPPIDKCQQPMKVGPCRASIPKWYYDTNLNECQRFNYGGCQGNENNFNSESACRSECSAIVTTEPTPIGKCQQPMKVGPCRASIPKWYYDTNLNECQQFNYGGCQGNENNFNSKSACRSECSVIVKIQRPIDKCQMPKETGPCRAALKRWFYDSDLKECRKFYYGGCDGNENQFDSEAACRAECAPTTPAPFVEYDTGSDLSDQPSTSATQQIGCLLDIKRDLNGHVPLMLTQNDEFTNFATNEGYLEIPVNQTIKLVCPLNFNKLLSKEIIVTCASEKQFLHQPSGKPYEYSDLKCTDQWQYKNIKTGRQCLNGDSELLNVGFEIRGRFQEIYQVCLNRITNNPFYIKHNLVQALPNAVSNKDTPWFDNEHSVDLDATFDCGTQNTEISRTLNKEFHNDGCCFAKRMLVNPLDVAPGLAQDATYSYLNIAPHWSSCNSQNWEAIEQRIRNLRMKLGRPLQVWTGVAQHLQIADASSELQNITLSQSGKQFQVPKYFWKVVQDSGTKAALAIVQVNIPDLALKDARKYILCPDVCRSTTWMNGGAALEDVFKTLNPRRLGININGEYITHLRFADDIVVLAETIYKVLARNANDFNHVFLRYWRNPARGFTYCCDLNKFKSAFQLAYYGVLPTSQHLLLDATTIPNLVV